MFAAFGASCCYFQPSSKPFRRNHCRVIGQITESRARTGFLHPNAWPCGVKVADHFARVLSVSIVDGEFAR